MLLVQPTFSSSTYARQGVVLLVVIAMLALFASVGLSFVFYAQATSVGSSYYVQAHTLGPAEVEPELALRYFLGQLIYDTDNEYSSLRGHGLGYGIYGYNPAGRNDQAYAGHGRLRYQLAGGPDNHQLINYRYVDGDLFFRDPGYFGSRVAKTGAKGPLVGGEGGVPWTYPDLDNLFLAAVNASGEVLLPSFTRPWTMLPSATFDPSLPPNQKWLKHLTMRPHVSQHPQFNPPDGETIFYDGQRFVGPMQYGTPPPLTPTLVPVSMDVKNLDWGRGVPRRALPLHRPKHGRPVQEIHQQRQPVDGRGLAGHDGGGWPQVQDAVRAVDHGSG